MPREERMDGHWSDLGALPEDLLVYLHPKRQIVGFELNVPISRSFLEIAPARPNIMAGGYLLKSDDFMSSGSTWPAWLHFSPSQQQMSKSEERVVALATNWPDDTGQI